MAQKRRGLGRGLQALIPETQKEKVSASRPSDVFFPDSRKADVQDDENAASQIEHAGPEPESAVEARSTRDLTATLLAPSQRKRGSKSRSTHSTLSRTPDTSKQSTSVSRETTPDSSSTTKKAEKKTEKTSSSAISTRKTTRSASQSTRKRSAKKTAETPSSSSQAAEKAKADEQPSQPERVEAVSATVEESSRDDVAAVDNPTVEPAAEPVSTSDDPVVSRETEEKQSEVVDAQPSSKAEQSIDGSVSSEAHDESDDDENAEEPAADTPNLVPVPGARFAEIPVGLIHPNPRQPRQVFDDEDISELAASIAEVGLLQPIVVRQVPTSPGEEPRYELIMGERRLRASKEAGLETIPAVVRDTDDVDMLRDALLENLHRVQLNPLEEAAAYQQLLEDFQCTHAELSERIARSRSQISNTLRLMKLPPLVQRRLAANVISAGHARALLGLPNAAAMERLAQRVVAEGLSVRATEELVALHEDPESGSDQPKVLRARSTPLPALSTRLSDAFDTRVKVTRGAKKGRITIEFAGDEDLARIVGALAPGTSLDEE